MLNFFSRARWASRSCWRGIMSVVRRTRAPARGCPSGARNRPWIRHVVVGKLQCEVALERAPLDSAVWRPTPDGPPVGRAVVGRGAQQSLLPRGEAVEIDGGHVACVEFETTVGARRGAHPRGAGRPLALRYKEDTSTLERLATGAGHPPAKTRGACRIIGGPHIGRLRIRICRLCADIGGRRVFL